jgi:hypothetical protein
MIDEGLLNPYINWPFDPDSTQLMADWVKEAAALGVRTKFYYTVRELSNHCAEIWALRSLGTEILAGGSHTDHGTQVRYTVHKRLLCAFDSNTGRLLERMCCSCERAVRDVVADRASRRRLQPLLAKPTLER